MATNRKSAQKTSTVGKKAASKKPPSVLQINPKSALKPKAAGDFVVVQFGAATIQSGTPPKTQTTKNIQAGRDALARTSTGFTKSGIKLNAPNLIPLYHADPAKAGALIRNMGGKIEVGAIVNGKFRVKAK